jgi:hypothetical protein
MSFWIGILWVIATIEGLIAVAFFSARPTRWWSHQDWIGAFGLLVNALTLFSAVVGGTIAYGAFVQTQRQAEAAEEQVAVAKADQRPWLEISKPIVAEDIVFDNYGARISISFELSNVGKSPAFNVSPWISPYAPPFVSANSPVVPTVEPYQMPAVSSRVQAENILFPGRTVPRTATGYVVRLQVERATVATQLRLFPARIEVCVAYGTSPSKSQHKSCHTLNLISSNDGILMLPDPLISISKTNVKVMYRDGDSIAY